MKLRVGIFLILVGVFVSVAFRVGWGERNYTLLGSVPTGRILLRREKPAQYEYDSSTIADRLPRVDETPAERLLRKHGSAAEPRLISERVPEVAFPARYSDLVGLCLVFVGAVVVSMDVARHLGRAS